MGYRKEEKQKVVIVIEGIDLLTDSKGCAVLPSFWLPLTVPTNVKLILSASVPQNDLVNRVSVLQYSISKEKMGRIVSSLNDKAQSMYKAGNSNLIELTTIDKMMRICPNFSPSQGNCTQMVEEYIHFNSQQQ